MSDFTLSIERLEDIVGDVFGVDKKGFYTLRGQRTLSTARHMLWYILHEHMGMSNKEIADRYVRSKRKVIKYISEMKFRVVNQRNDREFYKKIMEEL